MNGSSLAMLLVGLVAGAVGLGAGWFLHGSAPAPVPALQVHAAESVTRAGLDAAKSEILAQLEWLGRARPASAPAAAAPASEAVIELGRRIDEIDARIALLSSGSRPAFGGRGWASMRGQGCESIEKVVERIQTNELLARKGEKQTNIEELLTREHYLWMLEDVIRQYGPPEHMDTSNGLALYYGRFQLEGTGETCCVCFRIVEGFVTDAGFDCSKNW
jgi:hypothetical protein